MPDVNPETRYYDDNGELEWRCKYCPKTYALSGGTAVIMDHLCDPPSEEGHGLERHAARDAQAKNQQTTIQSAMKQAEEYPYKRRRLGASPGGSIKPGVLEVLWVNVLVACSLALRLTAVPQFRAFLAYLNADIDVWLPKSHHSIREWVMRQFEDQKDQMKLNIQSAQSKIHISCDLWTSPNSLAILGIIAHFVDEGGKLRHCTLALKDILGEHTGESLAKAVLEALEEWGFISKLGFFIMDNAPNNDTMMKALQRGDYPLSYLVYMLTLIELAKLWRLKYDAKTHRLRCQGHIINLAVKSFLFVKDNENLEPADDSSKKYNISLEEIEQWRRQGPLGKLHNFVVYIHGSVRREQQFWELSHGLRLARDNKTRWNSWYNMLQVALNLKDAILEYYDNYPDNAYTGDILIDEDWATLEKIKGFLEKLKMATKAVESSNQCLDIILPVMDYVLKQFESAKDDFVDDDILAPMLNSGWSKFDKYYRLTEESPAYTAALVLNPKRKWRYIEKHWKKSWHKAAKDMVKKIWESEYRPLSSVPVAPAHTTTNDFWLDLDAEDMAEAARVDEYAQYCASPIVNTDDAIGWWMQETQRQAYPNLSKMAFDYLSIPGMSAEPERLFSSTKITVTDRRNRLGSDILEALQCLRSWLHIRDQEADLLAGLDGKKSDKEGQEARRDDVKKVEN
jgi:hypothetical protein